MKTKLALALFLLSAIPALGADICVSVGAQSKCATVPPEVVTRLSAAKDVYNSSRNLQLGNAAFMLELLKMSIREQFILGRRKQERDGLVSEEGAVISLVPDYVTTCGDGKIEGSETCDPPALGTCPEGCNAVICKCNDTVVPPTLP